MPTNVALFADGNFTTLTTVNSSFCHSVILFVWFAYPNSRWLEFCILMVHKLFIWNTWAYKEWLGNWIYLSVRKIANQFFGQSNAEINVRICSRQGARMCFFEKNVSIYNCCLKTEPVNMFPTPVSPPRNWVCH